MRSAGRILLRRKIEKAAVLIILVIGVAVPSWLRADDEFKGLPGLWKTTFLTGNSASHASPVVNWHCVYENSDPWTDFANISTPPDQACKKTYSYRTSTSLKWRLDCTGSSKITDEGS